MCRERKCGGRRWIAAEGLGLTTVVLNFDFRNCGLTDEKPTDYIDLSEMGKQTSYADVGG